MGSKGKFGLLIAVALLMAVVSIGIVYVIVQKEKDTARKEGIAKGKKEAKEQFEKQKAELLQKKPSTDAREVLVASTSIPPAVEITPDMVYKVEMPDDLFTDAEVISTFEEIEGRVAAHRIPEGDIMIAAKLRSRERYARPSERIPKGKRYLSLPIENSAQSVSAMIRIGDKIDILATLGSGEDAMSRIIIQMALVVDVENGSVTYDRNSEEGEVPPEKASIRPGKGDTITFEVTPYEAELFQALQASRMRYTFVLRNGQDDSFARTSGRKAADLIAGLQPKTKTKPQAQTPVRR